MAKNVKDFLVSTADVAFYVGDALAFTGTTSLNTSMTVSMQDQEVVGGQGNKLLYKFKYGRKLASSIEFAEWNLGYISANLGSTIFTGLKDVFKVAECITLTSGVGTLSKTPVAGTKAYAEMTDGSIVEITPVGATVTTGTSNDNIKVTYQYSTTVKRVTVDADSTPLLGRLVLTAQKHNNSIGKVGEIQIEVPSFQLSGNFDISMTAAGTSTTKMDGDALAVEGASCSDGAVYAYISEIDNVAGAVSVIDIVATPSVITLSLAGVKTKTISVVGLKGGMYSNISIENTACTFVSTTPATATVSVAGLITGVAVGVVNVTVTYGTLQDVIQVTVTA